MLLAVSCTNDLQQELPENGNNVVQELPTTGDNGATTDGTTTDGVTTDGTATDGAATDGAATTDGYPVDAGGAADGGEGAADGGGEAATDGGSEGAADGGGEAAAEGGEGATDGGEATAEGSGEGAAEGGDDTADGGGEATTTDGSGDGATASGGETAAGGEATTHVIQPGDTVGTIAQRYNVTIQDIVVANNLLNENSITAGETLQIVAGAAENAGGESAETAPQFDPNNHFIHVVSYGETLFIIGQRYGFTVEELAGYNGIANVNQIKFQQEIKIPIR